MISVLIPAYNSENYIAEAIESVLGQTFQEFEIIVVDDGSNDQTMQIVKSFSGKVQYFYQKNSGAGAARNTCVRLSRGDFLAFLDADDVWTPNKLELQMAEFKRDSSLEAVFGMVKQTLQSNWEKGLLELDFAPSELFEGFSPGTMIIKRESFLRVGMFSEEYRIGEFIQWFSRANEIGLKTKLIDDLVYRRRIHSTNLGVIQRGEYSDYLKILKQSINRRRMNKSA